MAALLSDWLVSVVLFTPLAGAGVILLMRPQAREAIQRVAATASLATLLFAAGLLWVFYEQKTPDGERYAAEVGEFTLVTEVPWIGGEGGLLEPLDISYRVGVDGISMWLIVLTALLVPVSVYASFSGIRERVREYYFYMLVLETGMLGVFCALDLILFFVFFELTLIPLFFIIGIWGGEQRREAANKFFIYTLAGSVLTFGGILYLGLQTYQTLGRMTFDLRTMYALSEQGWLSPRTQLWVFWALAVGFAVKVPLFPLHTWLPLAHTEAPTAGSVILAGILLKLGTYAFVRISLPILPDASLTVAPIVAGLSIAGIIYGALCAWVQEDIKKLVAFSSVSHLGFCMLGMFSMESNGMTGSVVYMINHGLSTGALFLLVGMVYERYHTRRIDRLGGLARQMPWLAFFLVFFTLSSIGLPGLNGFVGEFLVLLGAFTSAGHRGALGIPYAALAATGIVLGAAYMLYLCRRVLFGPYHAPPGTPDTQYVGSVDLNLREIAILTPIAVACLWIGVMPYRMLATITPAADRQVLRYVLAADAGTLTAQADSSGYSHREAAEAMPSIAGEAQRSDMRLAARPAPADEQTGDRPPRARSAGRLTDTRP